MSYSASILNACFVLIVTIFISFPCASEDTPVTKKKPATPTTVQPIPPAQIAPRSSRTSEIQTIVTAKRCKSNRDCPTLECWDGFCCDKHCMGKCVSCGMPGREGICTPVPDGQDPRRACTIVQGGHPACNTACYSGQCMWPDVGKPCEICAACNGTGRCTETPADDNRCGVISCKSQNTPCRTYADIQSNRCESLGLCKTATYYNCVNFTDHYSWKDANGVHRECATGKIMNCFKSGIHWVWQDGSVLRYCNTGKVCTTCKPEKPDVDDHPRKGASKH